MKSLRTRILTSASLVLAAFVLLCAYGLEQAFEESALQSQEDELRGITYALLGAAEPDPGQAFTIAPGALPDSRLDRPQSGLEAAVLDESGAVVWSSPSTGGDLPDLKSADVGSWRFHRLHNPERFLLVFGLRWLDPNQIAQRYTILVIEDARSFNAQIRAYRRTLWSWLVAISVGLLVAQFLVLRWGLSPLRRLVGELRDIEGGRRTAVEAQYPDELTPLTRALNAMIVAERNQQTRYRNALGDLAHSLKTPLAVLRGLEPDRAAAPDAQRSMREQIDRMQHIVDHQLRRAAAAGSRVLSEPLAVRPLAEKIAGALAKVYAAKRLAFELDVPRDLRLRADEGDLYELLGNLLDNAAKWARSKVALHVEQGGGGVRIHVDDDGPGFPDDVEVLAQRGVRADSKVPGQGIGLATAAEIVKAYNGALQLIRSPLGGARVVVQLPA